MYNQAFYMPGSYGMMPNLTRGAAMSRNLFPMQVASTATRGGLLGKLGNAFGAIKSLNWGGLINNTSKTLGIINQTIPLVRQVGPMVGNMRSMLKIASVFKDETDTPSQRNINQNINTNMNSQTTYQNNNQNNISNNSNNEKKEEFSQNYTQDNSPNFFIN